MKKQNSILFILMIIAIIILQNNTIFAQGCVQCRLGPGSNMQGGGHVASGINSGILYLLLIPYLLLMSIVCYVFRKQITEKWTTIKHKFARKKVTTA